MQAAVVAVIDLGARRVLAGGEERDPDPGRDHAEDQADDGDDDRDVGLVAPVGPALGPVAEDPALTRCSGREILGYL